MIRCSSASSGSCHRRGARAGRPRPSRTAKSACSRRPQSPPSTSDYSRSSWRDQGRRPQRRAHCPPDTEHSRRNSRGASGEQSVGSACGGPAAVFVRAATGAGLVVSSNALLQLPAVAGTVALAPGVYIEDYALWQSVLLSIGLAGYSTLLLAQNSEGLLVELSDRLGAVESLEVRLDVTTLWCYTLARELIRNIPMLASSGIQINIGFNSEKLMHLLDVCGSSSALCIAWITCGIVSRQFERANFDGNLSGYLRIAWATSISAGMLWQVYEQYFYSAARPELLEATPLDVAGGLVSMAGLCAVMLCYRWFSWYIP